MRTMDHRHASGTIIWTLIVLSIAECFSEGLPIGVAKNTSLCLNQNSARLRVSCLATGGGELESQIWIKQAYFGRAADEDRSGRFCENPKPSPEKDCVPSKEKDRWTVANQCNTFSSCTPFLFWDSAAQCDTNSFNGKPYAFVDFVCLPKTKDDGGYINIVSLSASERTFGDLFDKFYISTESYAQPTSKSELRCQITVPSGVRMLFRVLDLRTNLTQKSCDSNYLYINNGHHSGYYKWCSTMEWSYDEFTVEHTTSPQLIDVVFIQKVGGSQGALWILAEATPAVGSASSSITAQSGLAFQANEIPAVISTTISTTTHKDTSATATTAPTTTTKTTTTTTTTTSSTTPTTTTLSSTTPTTTTLSSTTPTTTPTPTTTTIVSTPSPTFGHNTEATTTLTTTRRMSTSTTTITPLPTFTSSITSIASVKTTPSTPHLSTMPPEPERTSTRGNTVPGTQSTISSTQFMESQSSSADYTINWPEGSSSPETENGNSTLATQLLSDSNPAIIGGVIGGFVLLLIVLVIAFIFGRQQKGNGEKNGTVFGRGTWYFKKPNRNVTKKIAARQPNNDASAKKYDFKLKAPENIYDEIQELPTPVHTQRSHVSPLQTSQPFVSQPSRSSLAHSPVSEASPKAARAGHVRFVQPGDQAVYYPGNDSNVPDDVKIMTLKRSGWGLAANPSLSETSHIKMASPGKVPVNTSASHFSGLSSNDADIQLNPLYGAKSEIYMY